jgi:hypothetical protein
VGRCDVLPRRGSDGCRFKELRGHYGKIGKKGKCRDSGCLSQTIEAEQHKIFDEQK